MTSSKIFHYGSKVIAEIRHCIWFPALSDWSKNLAPTLNPDLKLIAFSIASAVACHHFKILLWDLPSCWLLWFQFYDSQSERALYHLGHKCVAWYSVFFQNLSTEHTLVLEDLTLNSHFSVLSTYLLRLWFNFEQTYGNAEFICYRIMIPFSCWLSIK